MTQVRPPVPAIRRIHEQHLEELAFLWGQRRVAMWSVDYPLFRFLELEERIAAHLDGLVVAGESAGAMLEAALEGGDGLAASGAALTLIHLRGAAGAEQVFVALEKAEGERVGGLSDALCFGPAGVPHSALERLVAGPSGEIAAAAAEVLAFRAPGELRRGQPLEPLMRHESADVRRAAWRVAGLVGMPLPPRAYEAAAGDEHAAVRSEVALAAALARVPWVVERATRVAARPGPQDVELLTVAAVVAGPAEARQLLAAGRAASLGPARFAILASLGDPQAVPALLPAMDRADPATAAAAGAAFWAITGMAVPSGVRAPVVPPGGTPDEFEREFLDEVMLPDPAQARKWWAQNEGRFVGGTRWCRGADCSGPAAAALASDTDMAAHWDAMVRDRFRGGTGPGRAEFERFPRRPA